MFNQTKILIMAKILISDLRSMGSGLFSDSESFIDSMQDLSENELKMTFGGKKNSSKSKSKKSSSSGGCYCPPPSGGSGGGAAVHPVPPGGGA
jgi:hypothetical protein